MTLHHLRFVGFQVLLLDGFAVADLEAVAEGVFEPSAVFFASDDVIFAASTAARAAFASATIRATLSSVDSDALAASFAASAAEEAPAPPETLC